MGMGRRWDRDWGNEWAGTRAWVYLGQRSGDGSARRGFGLGEVLGREPRPEPWAGL